MANTANAEELRDSAHGFPLSYIWLAGYEIDFRTARDLSLLRKDTMWKAWTAFATVVLQSFHARAAN